MSEKDLTNPFDTKQGFRQKYSPSCDFFNLMMERILRAADLRNSGIIFDKSFMLLAYADDIDIIGRNMRTGEEVTSPGFNGERGQNKIYAINNKRDWNVWYTYGT